VGRIRRRHAVGVRDLEFLRSHTQRRVKVTVPGPFTMSQQAQIDYYSGSREAAAMDYAEALNAEIRDLFSAGADVVQIDEPYMQARPQEARTFGLKALNAALDGISGTTAVHICFGCAAIIHVRPSGYSFLPELAECSCRQISIETAQSSLDCAVLKSLPGKKIMLGVIDLADHAIESPELVASRIRRALPFISASDLLIAPDCGMKYLPRAAPSASSSRWPGRDHAGGLKPGVLPPGQARVHKTNGRGAHADFTASICTAARAAIASSGCRAGPTSRGRPAEVNTARKREESSPTRR
jgi:5-methyltetrahydropteroyltriglutamate--homocysteine methyltransferase